MTATPEREGRCAGRRSVTGTHARQRRSSTGSIVACQLSAAIGEQVQKLSQQLSKEKEKNKVLLNRAQEAESVAVWLKEELDLSAASTRNDDPESARKAGQEGPGATPPGPPQTQPGPGEAPRSATCDDGEEDPNVFTMFIEQNFRLREELNQEKQKFSDLKREMLAHTENFCAGVEANQHLQEELARLHEENAQLREDLRLADQREKDLKHENAALSAKVADFESSSDKAKREEMEILVQTMSLQLFKVEQELSECLNDFSELVDPFLRSALTMSMRMCIACQKHDTSVFKKQKLPQLCDPESGDIRMKFESVLGILSYVLGVIEPQDELGDFDVMGTPAGVMALAN